MTPALPQGDVLVVGAGPTGLTAALALVARGIPVQLVERRSSASNLSRAVGILPQTIDALRPLGAADAILAEALPLTRFTLFRDGSELANIDLRDAAAPDRVIYGLPQDRTETILRDTLERHGETVRFNAEVIGLVQDSESVTVSFADGTTSRHSWVIACDGAHSHIRQTLGIAFDGYEIDGKWSIADVDTGPEYDSTRVMMDLGRPGQGVCIALPIEKHRARVVAARPDALAGMKLPLPVVGLRRAADFAIPVRQAETYAKGRVLLAGDAAHCHSPVGGRGMNLGMADAVAAAQAILAGDTDSYAIARHRAGAEVIRTTERLRKILTRGNPLVALALRVLAFGLRHSPRARLGFMTRLTRF